MRIHGGIKSNPLAIHKCLLDNLSIDHVEQVLGLDYGQHMRCGTLGGKFAVGITASESY
jgi:hypothetical protein